jgi:hypothetical protein
MVASHSDSLLTSDALWDALPPLNDACRHESNPDGGTRHDPYGASGQHASSDQRIRVRSRRNSGGGGGGGGGTAPMQEQHSLYDSQHAALPAQVYPQQYHSHHRQHYREPNPFAMASSGGGGSGGVRWKDEVPSSAYGATHSQHPPQVRAHLYCPTSV